MEDFKKTMELRATPDRIFDALRNGIPLWWTELFEGTSDQIHNTFTVRFGDSIFKTMQIKEIVPNIKLVWYITDSLIGIPELRNQTEWIDTTIVWELTPLRDSTRLQLTHKGLNSSVECYTICCSGWHQFTDSLKSYVQSGKGYPYRVLVEE